MSKTFLGKQKKPNTNSKLYKKSKKRIPARNNFVVVFANKLDVLTHMPREVRQEVIIAFLHLELQVVDGGWGTRWWRDIDGGAENEEWAVFVEDGKVGVHGDVTVDRSGSGMLDGGWNFSWDDCALSDEEYTEVDEVMSLVGLADGIWSEVVLGGEENTWRKGGDAVNVCNFGGAVGELIKHKKLTFLVEGCCWGWQWLKWRWLGKHLNWKKVWPG